MKSIGLAGSWQGWFPLCARNTAGKFAAQPNRNSGCAASACNRSWNYAANARLPCSATLRSTMHIAVIIHKQQRHRSAFGIIGFVNWPTFVTRYRKLIDVQIFSPPLPLFPRLSSISNSSILSVVCTVIAAMRHICILMHADRHSCLRSAEQFVGYLREIAESCARRSDSNDALTLISSKAILVDDDHE